MSYVKSEFGVKDIEKLTGEHVKSFLEYKIEQGISYRTFQQYAAAVEKLEIALNRYSEIKNRGNFYNFGSYLKQVREIAKDTLEKTNPTRAYENPMKGIDRNPFTNKEIGKIEVQGKGGYIRHANVSADTYKELEDYVKEKGEFKIDKNAYRADLKSAAAKSGQEYTGSHGLRWNFAQERFNELQKKGNLTYEQALKQVFEEMGHHRADIKEYYLRT